MKVNIPLDFFKTEGSGGHLYTRCTIGNQEFTLLIDTGSSHTVFDQNLPEVFFIERKQFNEPVESLGRFSDRHESAVLKQISINRFQVDNLPVKLMDLNHIVALFSGNLPFPLAGLIGGDFLSAGKAEIDYHALILKIGV